MADFSLVGGGAKVVTAGIDLSLSSGVTVVGGAINTKGAWSELSASTGYESCAVVVQMSQSVTSTNGARILLDIGVGGAGSEEVILSNLISSQVSQSVSKNSSFEFPLKIPAGVRVSARIQSTTATRRETVSIQLLTSSMSGQVGAGAVDTYGITAASSTAVQIDCGGTADTKGAWSEITASTTNNIKGIFLGIGGNGNAATDQFGFLIDIGVGASGSEEVIVPDITMNTNTVEQYLFPAKCYGVSVASGQRLSVRGQSNTIDATDRVFEAALYGVR